MSLPIFIYLQRTSEKSAPTALIKIEFHVDSEHLYSKNERNEYK